MICSRATNLVAICPILSDMKRAGVQTDRHNFPILFLHVTSFIATIISFYYLCKYFYNKAERTARTGSRLALVSADKKSLHYFAQTAAQTVMGFCDMHCLWLHFKLKKRHIFSVPFRTCAAASICQGQVVASPSSASLAAI